MQKISILLPVHNAEQYLPMCLDSILNQTWENFELIAADDASTDSSGIILENYARQDFRIKIITNPYNSGIAKTRNLLYAAASADSEFLALMDADDICFPDRLSRQMDFLRRFPEIDAVGSALEIINQESKTIGFRHYPLQPAALKRKLMTYNVFAQSTLLLRRRVVEKTGGYDESCKVCSDYDYWLRALRFFTFANLDEPVIRYRLSEGQCKQKKLKQSLATTLRIQRNYLWSKEYFSLSALVRHLAGYGLLLLPTGWILSFFQRLTYHSGPHE